MVGEEADTYTNSDSSIHRSAGRHLVRCDQIAAYIPFIIRVFSVMLACVFILSAIAKSIQPGPLEKMLATVGVGSGKTLIVFLLSAFEILLGAWLLSAKNQMRPLLVFAVVLAVFTGGCQVLLSLGIEDSCGCFGAVFESTVESARNRNAVFLFVCLFSLFCAGAVRRQKGPGHA